MSQFQPKRLMENWEDSDVLSQASKASAVNVKKEHPASSYMYGNGTHEEFEEAKPNWSQVMPAASSPKSSCLTSLISSKNMLDFSSNYNRSKDGRLPPPDRSSDQVSEEIETEMMISLSIFEFFFPRLQLDRQHF